MEDRPAGAPPIETICADAAGRTDTGYTLRVHMHGLHGTWHRLWALIVTRARLGDEDILRDVEVVRAQLEQLLGRTMTVDEWAKLEGHAIAHASRLA